MSDANRKTGFQKAAVRVTERIALALAGRRWMPIWAVIHHRGRSSGVDYATPIAIIPTIDKKRDPHRPAVGRQDQLGTQCPGGG